MANIVSLTTVRVGRQTDEASFDAFNTVSRIFRKAVALVIKLNKEIERGGAKYIWDETFLLAGGIPGISPARRLFTLSRLNLATGYCLIRIIKRIRTNA